MSESYLRTITANDAMLSFIPEYHLTPTQSQAGGYRGQQSK